jgi:hypothetical protein
MGDIRAPLTGKHANPVAVRQELARHIEAITLLPEGKGDAFRYKCAWKLLGDRERLAVCQSDFFPKSFPQGFSKSQSCSGKLPLNMFYLKRTKVGVDRLRNSGIVFECVLKNGAPRTANVICQEYELWLATEGSGGPREFISRLSFDLTSISTSPQPYQQQELRPFKLIWPFSPNQLQRIEDYRQGKEPYFELRNRVVAHVRYIKTDGSPHGDSHFVEEAAYDMDTNGYPIHFKIDHVTWAEILNAVDFKQIILHELSIPTFPPAFQRPENHLKEAWGHHRAGREDAAMMSCFKAFECLGYSISGAQLTRADVLADLMTGQEDAKREKIKTLWESLSEYCHLGRHDKGPPVQLTHADGELAVVSATVLLRYLAGQTK